MMFLVVLGFVAAGAGLALVLVRLLGFVSPAGALALTVLGPAGVGLAAVFC